MAFPLLMGVTLQLPSAGAEDQRRQISKPDLNVFKQRVRDLRRCEAAFEAPGAKKSDVLHLSLDILSDGRVEKVGVLGELPLGAKGQARCIVGALRDWQMVDRSANENLHRPTHLTLPFRVWVPATE
jgi:hypothetical protein